MLYEDEARSKIITMSSSSTQRSRMSILVVGAGPVGLMAACTLAKKGHQVKVIERRAELPQGGGDIQLSPNGTMTLQKLGMEDAVGEVMNIRKYITMRNAVDFSVLFVNPIDFGDKTPSLMFRRADLSRALARAAQDLGVQFEFSARVTAVNDSAPSISVEDGRELAADLIIAADGVASTLRTLVFHDRLTRPVALDEVCFQWSTPYASLASDPDLLELWEEGKRGFSLFCSTGTYLTCWTNEATQSFFTIFTLVGYNKPVEVGSWTRPGNVDEMKSLLRPHYTGAVSKLIQMATHCELWRIADSVEGADWVSPSGKIVFVGDAIHAMPPNAAQGLSQGFEDIATLNVLLDAATTNPSTSKVSLDNILLENYEKIRRPRVEKVMQRARVYASIFTLPPGKARDTRDERWRAFVVDDAVVKAYNVAPVDANANVNDLSYAKWVVTYDAMEMATQHLAQRGSNVTKL